MVGFFVTLLLPSSAVVVQTHEWTDRKGAKVALGCGKCQRARKSESRDPSLLLLLLDQDASFGGFICMSSVALTAFFVLSETRALG